MTVNQNCGLSDLPNMNFAEWFNIIFFSVISVFALVIPLPRNQRILACAIGSFGIAVCLLMFYSPAFLSEKASLNLRNWIPVMLIFIAYHQSGQLFNKPRPKFQALLLKLDNYLLGGFYRGPEVVRSNFFLSGLFEISYLVCYPLVPAALGALTLINLQDRADEFWIVVLPSTYVCYALIPFFPAFPPRLLDAVGIRPVPDSRIRAINIWILRHASIQANTFPSAHVAACTSASLVLLRHDVWIGTCFLCVSLSIAASVVMRRYHYTADAILGIAISFVTYILTA